MIVRLILAILLFCSISQSTEISITGTIKDEEGKTIENALIRFEQIGYVTTSNADGGFVLSETSPIKNSQRKNSIRRNISVRNNEVFFSVSDNGRIQYSVFTLKGKLCFQKELTGVAAGNYHTSLRSMLPTELPFGMYVIQIRCGLNSCAVKIVNRVRERTPFRLISEHNGVMTEGLARQMANIDEITVSKLGYTSVTIPIESYNDDIGEVVLKKSSEFDVSADMDKIEDSLFNALLEKVAQVEELDGPDELSTIDYIGILNGFEALLEIDSTREKTNIGYMLASIASLNVNSEIWKISDSLDVYFSSFNNESENDALMKKAMQKGGVLGLGKALVVKTPQVVMSGTENPSFPKFMTISYLQNVMEKYLIPVLNNILEAAERIESKENASMILNVDDETFEIDKGEVYLFDATVNLLRAYCYMFCIYDMDLYTSESQQNYSWIDTLVNIEDYRKTVYSLSGDTLYAVESSPNGMKTAQTAVSMLYYNIEERDSFMTIRKPFHDAAHNCLKAVPAKIKSGLASIRAEEDTQDDDIIKIAMIDTANSEMLDLSAAVRDEGFSAAFSEHFSSIDKLMDFVDELLSGPVTFNEVIDGKEIDMKVDLSAFFTNPIEDLRMMLPEHAWTNKEEWFKAESNNWEGYVRKDISFNEKTESDDTLYYFTVYSYENEKTEIDIDATLYRYKEQTDYRTEYELLTPVNAFVRIDSSFYFDALRLKDGDGNIMSNETIDTLIENEMFFPYFKDYTFNGVFPDMTREKWLDLIWGD